jgi:aminopeptidase N
MWLPLSAALAGPVAHHVLEVTLDPAAHALAVTDDLTLPVAPDPAGHVVWLHAGLAPTVLTQGWTLVQEPPRTVDELPPREAFRLVPPKRKASWPVRLAYAGPIEHPPIQVETEYQRSFAVTPGTIGPEGAVLSGESAWVPATTREELVTFTLTVRGLPPGWGVVSQGERSLPEGAVAWSMPHPTEGVHLVAGPFTETATRYVRADGTAVDVRALLRTPDDALAAKYLEATVAGLARYESMLPRYPYPSFALVENWWETGWGMPGFTLLGPEVIRFPFVITSSYPHELLHNWWGNGVYVAPGAGNWCEGLTAYLADHLFAEERGEGPAYRRATLQKYADFAGAGDDLPLDAFRGRVSARTEAIGYGKATMVLHQARRAAGDEVFLGALGRFYDRHAFGPATWDDLAAALSEASGADWRPWVDAWTDRPGAPALALGAATVTRDGSAHVLTVTVRQEQPEDVFPADVPVAVTLEGRPEATWLVASFPPGGPREVTLTARLDHAPLRLDLDPAFDVMRRLDPREVPPALTTLFGEGPETFVLPASAPEAERAAWTALAEAWAKPAAPVLASDADPLPAGNVWVLGWDNRHAAAAAAAGGATLGPTGATPGGTAVERAGHSVVTVGSRDDRVVGLVAAAPSAAIPGLARKLPHYGKYTWLAFEGDAPTNVAKGSIDAEGAPTTRLLGPPTPRAALPRRPPLAGPRPPPP